MSPSLPDQYDIGAPLMTSGPAMSGRAAASIITAQPPWQLPTITGFWLSRMALGDDADEFGFGVGHVGERLAGLRIRDRR